MATAMGICTTQGKIAAGYCLKTAAMTKPKIAKTTVRAMNKTKRKSKRTRLLSNLPAMSPTVCPLLRRTDHQGSEIMHCPNQDRTEEHPKQGRHPTPMMAMAGPTIGPVPAIEVK